MNILGIDLGNSYTKCAVPDALGNPVLLTNRNGEPQTRSAIFVGATPPIIGQDAVMAGAQAPTQCIINWKRSMGTDKILAIGLDGREYRAQDCAAALLQACKQDYLAKTGQELQAVVIGVPANYNQRQREETKAAAESVGLEVIKLIDEPNAAALGNQIHNRPDGLYLLADLGGSTFDASLIRKSGNNVEVLASRGIQDLGGYNYDLRLAEHALVEFEKEHGFQPDPGSDPLVFLDLLERAQQCKHTLGRMQTGTLVVSCRGKMTCVTFAQPQVLSMYADLNLAAVGCLHEVLRDAKASPQDILELLAVGGGAPTLGFRECLETLGIKPSSYCEAIYAAAYGCVSAARMELDRQNRPLTVGSNLIPSIDLFMHERTSHDVGVTVLTRDHQRLVNAVIVSRNTMLPCDQTVAFRLAMDGATDARIELLQGDDGADRDRCLVLGHFDLADMAPVFGTPHRIDIRLRIDRSGMLVATAQDTVSGKTAELTVDYRGTAAASQNSGPGPAPALQTA